MPSNLDSITRSFAILAPVPLAHLKSAQAEQLDPVAFGSRVYDTFFEAEQLRAGKRVQVYLYASWLPGDDPEEHITPPSVTWQGLYVRCLDPAKPRDRREIPALRPPSTENERGWGVYWVLEGLTRLSSPLAIASFRGLKQRSPYRETFVPEEPLLIEYPRRTSSLSAR